MANEDHDRVNDSCELNQFEVIYDLQQKNAELKEEAAMLKSERRSLKECNAILQKGCYVNTNEVPEPAEHPSRFAIGWGIFLMMVFVFAVAWWATNEEVPPVTLEPTLLQTIAAWGTGLIGASFALMTVLGLLNALFEKSIDAAGQFKERLIILGLSLAIGVMAAALIISAYTILSTSDVDILK